MKRFLILFFAALLIAPVSFSEEESFFTEESFGSTIFANDEAFFEESSFFGENGSVNSITEDSALPPVEGPAGADVEGRSLLLLATDTENPYPYPAPTYTYKKGYDPENPDKLKPGEVKLTWEQKDQNGTVIKKLAKGWKWVIYETDPENGVWLQVGTTTKPTITLKN